MFTGIDTKCLFEVLRCTHRQGHMLDLVITCEDDDLVRGVSISFKMIKSNKDMAQDFNNFFYRKVANVHNIFCSVKRSFKYLLVINFNETQQPAHKVGHSPDSGDSNL